VFISSILRRISSVTISSCLPVTGSVRMVTISTSDLIYILVNECYQSKPSHRCGNGPHHSQVTRNRTCTAVASFRWANVLLIPGELSFLPAYAVEEETVIQAIGIMPCCIAATNGVRCTLGHPLGGHSCTNTSRSPPSCLLLCHLSPRHLLFNVTDTFRLQHSRYWNLPPSEPCTIWP
jgi:hypothetical protein